MALQAQKEDDHFNSHFFPMERYVCHALSLRYTCTVYYGDTKYYTYMGTSILYCVTHLHKEVTDRYIHIFILHTVYKGDDDTKKTSKYTYMYYTCSTVLLNQGKTWNF